MWSAIWESIQLMFAGLWAYVWHWGFVAGFVVLCVVGALASNYLDAIPLIGPWLAKVTRKDFLWGALAGSLVLGGMWIGNHDASNRCKAQQVVVVKTVHGAVEKAKTKPSKPGRWETDE